ncbi:MAG: hypothetical protein B6I22_07950 [Desulfobacteraceae bacterium 4572_123]|nr:MAG: hypothetical protein B6I22_07950 [Desulfobacteraceae bacterium 4572_123]
MKQKNFFSFKLFVPGFTIIFGIVLIVFAVMRVAQTESFLKRAERTTGTILEVHQGILVWSAVIKLEFHDAAGSAWKAEFETGGETTSLKKGDSVNLLYDPTNKSSVYVGDPRLNRYPVSSIYFILGGCLIFFTIYRLRKNAAGTEDSLNA